MSETRDMTKVVFRVESEDGSCDVETPWATPVGDDLYRVENSPFYAYEVSWLDIVRAPYSEEEERPLFSEVVEKSGHKTIRVIFDPPVEDGNESDAVLRELVEIGCTYEGATRSYICIDIPPEIELSKVRKFLIDKEATFEHADPTYEQLFPEQ
ncbi:MAG: DUF4265 domain-containing protein [Pseudomonadota bacterium]